MKGQIHHIEFWVSDLQKSLQFWSWILEYLGYKKYQEWTAGVSYKLGDSYIAFEAAKEDLDIQYNRKRVGLNHIAFHLDSKEQLRELVELLKQKKISLLYQDDPKYEYTGDNEVIHIEDPDKIEIELVAKI